jgi:hypothetical protein
MNDYDNSLLAFEPINDVELMNSSCLTNLGLYIIQKIKEEDYRKDELFFGVKEEQGKAYYMSEEELQSKISITELIRDNRDILMNLEEFYEEECQWSLLRWIWKIHKRIKKRKSSDDYSDKEDCIKNINKNNLNRNEEILIFNIINIFEIFPIKPNDLKSLNFIEKLKAIKKTVKSINLSIYKKIKKVVKFWKTLLKFYDEKNASFFHEQSKSDALNQKRLRENDETDDKKNSILKEDDTNTIMSSILSLDDSESGEKSEYKKKSVSWKSDNFLVDKIEFDPKMAPSEN